MYEGKNRAHSDAIGARSWPRGKRNAYAVLIAFSFRFQNAVDTGRIGYGMNGETAHLISK